MLVFDTRKWFVSTTTMITMAMVMIDSMRVADGKLDGKIDLVIITSSFGYAHDRAFQKESISKLPIYVEMGNDKVRVAIVSQGSTNGTATIEFPLSGDQSGFQAWVENWKQQVSHRQIVFNALRLCEEQVFDFADNDRAKIIIIHIAWRSLNPNPTRNIAALLRKLGVRIYVVYNKESDHMPADVASWTTSARNFSMASGTEVAQRSMEKMSEITPAIVRDLCGLCRFDEQGSCNGKLYEGADDPDYFGDNRVKCQDANPTEISCTMASGSKEECDFECNRRWSWEKPQVKHSCTGGICVDVFAPNCTQLECGVMKRIGDGPPTHMENCPRDSGCGSKPVCPTTTAMTSTSTTTSSTASSIATTAESSPSTPPQAKEGTASPSEGLSVGVIAGIAVAAVVVILLVIIIATVIFMKKRKNGREKKEMLDLKMEKDRRSKSGSKSAGFVDDSIQSKTKGAQTSVMADMSIAQSVYQAKQKSATGGAKSKESKGVDGSKMLAKSSQVSKMAEGKKPGSKSSLGDVKKSTSSKMESSKKK